MNNKIHHKLILNYKSSGWVIIKNFFNKREINKVKNQLLNKISKSKDNGHFYFEKIGNRKRLRRIERISDFSKTSKKIITSKKLLEIIYKIKKKKFDLFKDKLNFKYPGGKGYLPHIDGHFYWRDKNNKIQNGWKKYSNDFVNLVIPLERTDKRNGCLYLSKKKNLKKLGQSFKKITNKMIIGTPNIKINDKKKFNYSAIELNVGDICIFDWKCAHFSKNNNSNRSRMIFYATYFQTNKKRNVRKNYYLDKISSLNDKKNKSLLFN